jgi:hypothetical protein
MSSSLFSTLCSLGSGLFLGLVYGYSFVLQQRRALSLYRSHLAIIILSSVRFIGVLLLFTILLHRNEINSILLIISFIVTFWVLLFMKKASLYARS